MQRVKQHDLPHPLSIHLEPEEGLNSSVTVEFAVEHIPCMRDPKVRCYESNGCVVFEGYCPVDSQIPSSQCGLRDIQTSRKQQQDICWSQESGQIEAPYNPFVPWDIIPRLLREIIRGAAYKVLIMDDKKLSSGVGNLPANSTFPEKSSGSSLSKESISVTDAVNQWSLDQMNEEGTAYITERDRPTLIFPRLTDPGNSTGSSELSVANDPFAKKQWHTVGNIVEPHTSVRTPVAIDNIVDNISCRPSDAQEDAADLVTQRQWKRRAAHRGKLVPSILQQRPEPESAVSREDRVSKVLAAYTKSVPLLRRPEEDHTKKDPDLVSVSVSETDTGEIEVDLSVTDINNARGSSEESVIYADAACGTGHIDRDVSHCVLCGSPLQHRQHNQRAHYSKDTSTTGQPSRAMIDASTHTAIAKHVSKRKDKSMRKESTAHPLIDSRGQPSRTAVNMSAQASSTGHTQRSKEEHTSREVTAFPVGINKGQPSRAMIFVPTYSSAVEYKQHPKEKHTREEITAHPVRTSTSRPSRATRHAGTSAVEETQKPGKKHLEIPKIFVNDQDVAVYMMSHASRSTSKPSSKSMKEDDKTQCTLQHILFPKDTCPYSPSLTSLPLDESDIDYIIQRAQLAKAALSVGESLCPKERWELRRHHRHSSKSGRSKSSA